jgi:lipopolysaccharide export system protein LptA
MRGITVARVRRWLAAGAILLVLVLVGVLGYARYKTRGLLKNLPHRLGVDIKSETNGYTWSQSVKGHTLFTVHAAKAIQRENGKTTLHDVAITIYGPVGSNRTDSIKGAEFEYDQPNGVIRATGEVHLDLASPAQTAEAKPDAKRIKVTTSGLIFLQKLGVAATDEPIHFVYGDMRGGATGADYETDTGILRLRSDVTADGTQNGQLVHVRASAAEIDRNQKIATLSTAHVQQQGNTAYGDTVVLSSAKSGGIQAVEARGNTMIESASGTRAQSPHLHAHMADTGKLDMVEMTDGVTFQDAGGTGSSQKATLHFNMVGAPVQAVFDGSVKLDQTASGGGKSALTSSHLVADLMQDATKHTQLREAVATGAVLRSATPKAAPGGKMLTQTTVIHADTLHATTAQAGAKRYIAQLDGAGATKVEEDDGAGNTHTSSGDTLQAKLVPPGRTPQKNGSGSLESAVQTGHVVVTQHTAAANGKPAQDSRATASRADFEESSGKLVLTGSPQVTAPGLQIAAERISLVQGSGDSDATGSVNGTFIQENSNGGPPGDPVHVLADHATVASGGTLATFYGGSRPARMWTPTAQMDAPVIETQRANGRLTAHGLNAADRVHLTLPQSAASPTSKPQAGGGVMHITGGSLVYLPADGPKAAHADIAGGVRMEDASSQLNAANAVATLQSGGKQQGVLAGNIESVLATGSVRIQQPGRTAAGDRLVYTAVDQRYELTGTTAAPPHMDDSLHGTVTGVTLIFHGGDDSVEVAGEPGHRVHTETQTSHPSRKR